MFRRLSVAEHSRGLSQMASIFGSYHLCWLLLPPLLAPHPVSPRFLTKLDIDQGCHCSKRPELHTFLINWGEHQMTPALLMEGLALDGGWRVVSKPLPKGSTGGHFSVGYKCENDDGRLGFLKALDYQQAMAAPDPPSMMNFLTASYIYERDLCEKCSGLSRIARVYAAGGIRLDPADVNSRVDYLIFERAAHDVRSKLDLLVALDHIFVLRTLHNVAAALAQLHGVAVAHQDLKPSNVLVFDGKIGAKICDLGRSWSANDRAPHDDFPIAGDKGYAAIERAYQYTPTDESARRFAFDLYMLGNLVCFLFTKLNFSSLLIDSTTTAFRPLQAIKSRTPYSQCIPHLLAALEFAVSKVVQDLPAAISGEIRAALLSLCHPDPLKRGHPKEYGRGYSLQRYVSLFDRLTKVLQVKHFGG